MFTTHCFIRKNTLELCKKLEKLGYKRSKIFLEDPYLCIATAVNDKYPTYTTITYEMFDTKDPYSTWNCAGRINCKTNEELFLAIASLRDDSDKNQWFVMDVEIYTDFPQGSWFMATDRSGGRHVGTQIEPLYCHKATVEELIEHFGGDNVGSK